MTVKELIEQLSQFPDDMEVLDAGTPVMSMHAPWEITSKKDVYETYKCYKAYYKDYK